MLTARISFPTSTSWQSTNDFATDAFFYFLNQTVNGFRYRNEKRLTDKRLVIRWFSIETVEK